MLKAFFCGARSRALLLSTVLAVPLVNASGFTITGSSVDPDEQQYGFEAMFAEGKRFENFRQLERFTPTKTIPAATKASVLPRDEQPIVFEGQYMGRKTNLDSFLEQTGTAGFLVIKKGKVISERYFHGSGPDALHASFSMGKSFVSALVGTAIEDGAIKSVDDPIRDYLPELTSQAFEGVTVKHVLQMSSGLKFTEDYADPESDINKMSYATQTMSFLDYINTLERAHAPGTYNNYASINTQLLGILVARTTAKPLAEYLQEKLWQPLGMEQQALWMLDARGDELAMGGLAVSLRDYGRMGLLYLQQGQWQGQQVLPAQWVKDSVTPDASHLMPGKRAGSNRETGYQYQWWLPRNADGDFYASGIWGQKIYIDPKNQVVIVKLSADPSSFSKEVGYQQVEYLQQLSRSLTGPSATAKL